jgi:hypothetical protein
MCCTRSSGTARAAASSLRSALAINFIEHGSKLPPLNEPYIMYPHVVRVLSRFQTDTVLMEVRELIEAASSSTSSRALASHGIRVTPRSSFSRPPLRSLTCTRWAKRVASYGPSTCCVETAS